MSFIGACPLIYDITLAVNKLKLCACYLLFTSNIELSYMNLCGIIIHYDLINSSVLGNRESNVVCNHITIGSIFLMQRVSAACGKNTLNDMRFIGACPLVNDIALAVSDFELCAHDLLSAGNIKLCDMNLCGIVHHSNGRIAVLVSGKCVNILNSYNVVIIN